MSGIRTYGTTTPRRDHFGEDFSDICRDIDPVFVGWTVKLVELAKSGDAERFSVLAKPEHREGPVFAEEVSVSATFLRQGFTSKEVERAKIIKQAVRSMGTRIRYYQRARRHDVIYLPISDLVNTLKGKLK